MRSFQRRLSEFEAQGIRIVAISVDSAEVNKKHVGLLGVTFPLLSDTKAEVIRSYGVLHAGAGPKGSDIARPAEFLIDSNGVIRWRNLTESIAVRARPDQVLRALRAL